MSITKNKNVVSYAYKMNGTHLERVYEFMDHGLIVTHNFSWQKPVDYCCGKANKRIGFIKCRIDYGSPREVKLICYTALVRPIVEYASIIWNNFNRSQVQQLESIQRRITKFIVGNNNMSYCERLQTCNILPLTMRRDYLDASFLYNCINDKIDINILNYVEIQEDSLVTRANADPAIRFKKSTS